MSYKTLSENDLYLDDDLNVVKPSPYFVKKRGDASSMFFPRDLEEIVKLRDGESVCVELSGDKKGVALVRRTDDGYAVRYVGIAGELYTALQRRGEATADLSGYEPRKISKRAQTHFVEMVRIVTKVVSAVYRPYNLSDAPVYRLVIEELKRLGYDMSFKRRGFVTACVSAREYNLMVAASVACCVSFSGERRLSMDLYRLSDSAVFCVYSSFAGTDEDRKMITDHVFDAAHSDLAMLEMLCASIGWEFVCTLDGLGDNILSIGFSMPLAKQQADDALFLSPEQPIEDALKQEITSQFDFKENKD